jgi:hypothetical protein
MKLLLGKIVRIELCTSLMWELRKNWGALPGLLSGKRPVDVMVVGKENFAHILSHVKESETEREETFGSLVSLKITAVQWVG